MKTKKPIKKEKRIQNIPVLGKENKSSGISLYRKQMLDKGFDLVNITRLCEFKLGISGWCNDFNEPDEECYHMQVWYRDECIGILYLAARQNNFQEDYVVFVDDEDFIIFRKVPIDKNKRSVV